MEQMHEIVLSKNRLRDGAMVGRAMRAVKTLKKLDLSDNEMSDLRQGFHFKRHFRDWAILGCILGSNLGVCVLAHYWILV